MPVSATDSNTFVAPRAVATVMDKARGVNLMAFDSSRFSRICFTARLSARDGRKAMSARR